MRLQYFVGIDNGGTMIKAVVFDGDGNTICSVSNKTPLLIPQDGVQRAGYACFVGDDCRCGQTGN